MTSIAELPLGEQRSVAGLKQAVALAIVSILRRTRNQVKEAAILDQREKDPD